MPASSFLMERIDPDDRRMMTIPERMMKFPDGVYRLWDDFLTYKNITDASATPRNAWTVERRLTARNAARAMMIEAAARSDERQAQATNYDDEFARNGMHDDDLIVVTPRRQHEQQRRFLLDIQSILPLLILWVPPIIGFLPPILGALTPRQVLTRQFWNEYEKIYFSQLECIQRRMEYDAVADQFWRMIVTKNDEGGDVDIEDYDVSISKIKTFIHERLKQGDDPAGPIIDLLPIYKNLFASSSSSSSSSFYASSSSSAKEQGLPRLDEAYVNSNDNTILMMNDDLSFRNHIHRAGILSSYDTSSIPHSYWARLSSAAGVLQSLPQAISPLITKYMKPTWWLMRNIHYIIRTVTVDDDLLIREKQIETGCRVLTDLEVMDACLIRGLPVIGNITADEMRACLTNHLSMIRNLKKHLTISECKQPGFGLLMIHLPILRHSLKS